MGVGLQPMLSISGLLLPEMSSDQLEQTYFELGGFSARRLASGAMLTQTRWTRIGTRLAGRGRLPPPLDQIEWRAPFVLGCVAPRGIRSAVRVVELPTGRREDAQPFGFALLDSGTAQPMPVSVDDGVVTVDEIAVAAGYIVYYWPLITVVAPAGMRTRWDPLGAASTWELECEEV